MIAATQGRARASERLEDLVGRFAGRGRTGELGEVVDALGAAGLAMATLLLTLLALVPLPGPFGMVFGSLLALIALQLLLGARRLWLPQPLRRRGLPASALETVVRTGVPWLRRLEAWTEPRRMLPLTGRRARMLLAIPLLAMAFVLAFPIPLGNLPPAASLIAISLGLVARDGVLVIVGLGLAVVAIGWIGALILVGAELLATVATLWS